MGGNFRPEETRNFGAFKESMLSDRKELLGTFFIGRFFS